jgi:pyruvate, water dikinase
VTGRGDPTGREDVLDLRDVGLEQLSTAGPKLARLGRLAALGWRVPDGYVVTVPALAAWLTDEARRGLEALLAPPPVDAAGLVTLADRARQLIEAQPIGDALAAAIRAAHRRLEERTGRGPDLRVAVRSSGASEDAADASFAGQFDTYLGIRGADEVLVHVRRCWASLYTARSLEYRRSKGLPLHSYDLAVGVIELVDARSSGVLFTVDPATGDRARMVIEASWGLGESVVAGHVTPDRWVTDRQGAIRERHVSHKAVWSAFDEAAERVVEQPMPAELAGAPSLTDAEVAALCAQAARIEAEEGVPQDVEWAIDAKLPFPDGIFILQHRPETTWARVEPGAPVDHSQPFDPVRFALEKVWKVR